MGKFFFGHIVFKFAAFWPALIWHGFAAAVGVASWWLTLGGTVMLTAAKQRRRHDKQLAAPAD